MGEAQPERTYLRNGMPRPVLMPLAGGGSRLLLSSDTTQIATEDLAIAGIVEAVQAGVLLAVLLPPPRGQPLRLAEGMGVRSPISAPARHYLACRTGMEGQIAQAKAAERLTRWAGRDRARQRDQAQARQLARERLLEGQIEADRRRPLARLVGRAALPDWFARARAMYRTLMDAAQQAEIGEPQFFAVLDGETLPPAILNGTRVLPPSPAELRSPIGAVRTIRRYQRRVCSARRLVAAASQVSGEVDPARAARWLAEQIAAPNC